MKFGQQDVVDALNDFASLRYPPSPEARESIAALLIRMVPSLEALIWLRRTMVDRVGEWKGPMELRAVLCTHFRPLDGIEASSTIPGFRPEDGEARSLAAHEQLKAGGWISTHEGLRLIGSKGLLAGRRMQ